MRVLFILIISISMSALFGKTVNPNLRYEISIPEPHTHYAVVKVSIDIQKPGEVIFKMPVWTPGSYLVREFEKSVEDFSAGSESKVLAWKKKDKNSWAVTCKKAGRISISYKVYAFEFSVRTSFIDQEQALINPSSVCMLVNGFENSPGSLAINMPATYSKISTSLASESEVDAAKNKIFYFQSYDELADSPIQIGNQEEITFTVNGVPHTVALVGRNNADKVKLANDLKKVCETMTAVIGEHPCKKYLFIVQNVESGGGGLEHLNSTVVVMNRFAWIDENKYKSFLGLCAHEYFHLWNVKRIRPIELGPFDYNKENYTEQLWVAEGITSYYDEIGLYRAGFVSKNDFLKSLEGYINDLENRTGSKVQTLSESSFDAWIKEYRPNENSKNTTISYYAKGLVTGALLDATICASTAGKKNLDDLMKLLWQRYYLAENRGFTVLEFEKAASEVAGKDLTAFFDVCVRSTTQPDYKGILESLGLSVKITLEDKKLSGASTQLENGRTMVKFLERNSTFYDAGVNVNDELIAINNVRVNNDVEEILRKLAYPADLNILVNRSGLILNINTTVKSVSRFKISLNSTTDSAIGSAASKWLTKD